MPALLVPYIAIALSLMHFVLATGVTLHVLAHNRNPGSSVSWIGLAWLSPVVGSVLYLLLGINRVQRRARSARAVAPGGRWTRLRRHPPAVPTWLASSWRLGRSVGATSSRATPSPRSPMATLPIHR